MSSDKEISKPKAEGTPTATSHLLHGQDQLRAILEALGHLHSSGNPLALHEVIRRSREFDQPLPSWAAEALMDQEVALLNDPKRGKLGRYRQALKPHIRLRTYQSIMSWLKDIRRYKGMPRSVIQRWYDGELAHKPSSGKPNLAARCLEISHEALAPTFAECKIDTLAKAVANDPFKSYRDEVQDFRRASIILDEWEVEAKVLLIKDFFGPPSPPPKHIQSQIDEAEKLSGM